MCKFLLKGRWDGPPFLWFLALCLFPVICLVLLDLSVRLCACKTLVGDTDWTVKQKHHALSNGTSPYAWPCNCMEVSSIPKGCGLSPKLFVLSSATSLVHLCRLRDPETQRLSLQTLELLAIENSDVIIQHVCCYVCLCLFALCIY